MKALVTGFDPFGGDKVNPSSLAVGQLKKRIGEVRGAHRPAADVLRAFGQACCGRRSTR